MPIRFSLLIPLLVVLSGTAHCRAAEENARPPNIVVLLADDLGYADVGFHGLSDSSTPHIDSLAADGVRFTNGYVSGPYCSPTRAGLLTGRYQTRFGHEFNPGGRRQNEDEIGLPLTETTIAERLKSAGYATGLVGKWHLGAAPKFHPLQRGFDEFFGFYGGAHTYFASETKTIFRNREQVVENSYLTDAFAREAVDFIDRKKDQPFFLYLAFNAVHTPLDATDERLARFADVQDEQRRKYLAMLAALDEAVGKVLHKLRTSGLDDNTLIFFLSDNGGPTMLGTSLNGARNTPLRGSKRTTLEGGIRVPFVVRWKGQLPAGQIFHHPVIQLDILPTALAAVGLKGTATTKLDGVNLLPHLRGEISTPPHESLFWRLGAQRAIRHGPWKLVQYDLTADRAVGDDNVTRSQNGVPQVSAVRLYHLGDDVGETRDLSQSHPDQVRELEAAWQSWSAELAAPLWGPPQLAPRATTAGRS